MEQTDRERLSDLKRLDIWFNHELIEGDKFEVYCSQESTNVRAFMGKKPGEQRTAFEAKLSFEDNF